jgi:hypothetical protein
MACGVLLVVAAGCDTGDDRGVVSEADSATTTTIVDRLETPPETSDPRALATTEDGLALPEGDDPEVIGPLGDATAEFETEEGSVEIGEGTVPDLVPRAFPLPADFIVELASETATDAGFSGRSDQSFADLVEFFSVGLVERGFDADQRVATDTVAVFDFSGPEGEGSVAISSAPGGGQSILVTFEG